MIDNWMQPVGQRNYKQREIQVSGLVIRLGRWCFKTTHRVAMVENRINKSYYEKDRLKLCVMMVRHIR